MNALRVALFALTIGTSTAALAAPQTAPNPLFTGSDLFNLSMASDPQISPDGRQIAYTRRANDIMTDKARSSIWLVDVATGAQRPLDTSGGDSFGPAWSPDGKRLAYGSTGGGGAPQLFVRWMDSGQSARLTGLPDSPQAIEWSPDGRRIAYLMTVPDDGVKLGSAPPKPEGVSWAKPLEVIDKVTFKTDEGGFVKPGFDHIFIVDADGGAPRQLTFGSYNDGAPHWTRDGSAILFSAVRKDNWELAPLDSEVYRASLAGGEPVALTGRFGPDQDPQMSPDGRLIAYFGYDDHGKGYEQSQLYVMNPDGSAKRAIANLDRDTNQFHWAADGRSIYTAYEQDGSVTVARIGLNGSVSPLVHDVGGGGFDRPYAGGSFSVSNGGVVAYTRDSAGRPADVAVASGGKARTLTNLNDLSLSGKSLGQVRELSVRAPDGGNVPAWVVLPPGYQDGQKVPTILEIHGGPYAAYGPHFSADYQLYAAAGYAVLYTNPRGSTGYGQAFADGIEKTYPATNYDDLIAAVDAAVAAGVSDPDNLFVTGGSGGGVLTTWLVGKTNRFKAAAAQKPVINWTSQALTSDGVPFFGKYWMGGMPWENPQGYWARSPLSLVGSINTPTLVVVGTNDYRTPVSESEQLYSALKLKGVPTMLVKVPDASHGGIAARPSQAAAKASAIIAWFDKYRKR